jgi:hypothetical protein
MKLLIVLLALLHFYDQQTMAKPAFPKNVDAIFFEKNYYKGKN